MDISFDSFSNAAAQARNRDRDIVTVDSRRNVRIRRSRFRLVCWFNARRWARLAVNDAHEDVFLTGPGVKTRLSEENSKRLDPERTGRTGRPEPDLERHGKLQEVFGGNPRVQTLHGKYSLVPTQNPLRLPDARPHLAPGGGARG